MFARALVTLLIALNLPVFAHAKTWRIAVVSDMNQNYGSVQYTPALIKAIEHIRQSDTSLVISTGDMVAGQRRGLDYEAMWNAFHNAVSRPLAQSSIPLLPSPGNHDASAGGGFANERNHYRNTWNQFPAPRFNGARAPEDRVEFLNGVAQNWPFNYAVTMGPALFIGLDATLAGELINDQFTWLASVLEKSAPYTVKMVFGHVPLYPFAFDRATDYLGAGDVAFALRLEALLEKHKVNYFLSGHHHAYFPGRRPGAVRFVSVPLLGTGARTLLTVDRSSTERSPQAFLYLDFDAGGNITMQALKSPALTPIAAASLPAAISIPTRDAADCARCASFPPTLFTDPTRRTLYHRF